MLLFLAGFVCFQYGLSLLTSLFYLLANKIMLLAFSVLGLLGIAALLKAVYGELSTYFNSKSAALRQYLSLQMRRQDLARLKAAEWRQLGYLQRLKRQRLLAADNRKQAAELSASINQELLTAKSQLPTVKYKYLRKTLRKYRKQADISAMLALRQQLHVVD